MPIDWAAAGFTLDKLWPLIVSNMEPLLPYLGLFFAISIGFFFVRLIIETLLYVSGAAGTGYGVAAHESKPVSVVGRGLRGGGVGGGGGRGRRSYKRGRY